MRWKFHLAAAGLGLCLASGLGSPASADVTLPSPNCGLGSDNNCLVFNDFNVYSLALINFQAGFGPPSPGDPFYVSSNGSHIASALVIGSHDANAIDNQDQLPLTADQAYTTPTGPSAAPMFLMIPANQNAPTPLTGAGDFVAQAQTTINNVNTVNTVLGTSLTGNGSGQLPLWNVATSALKTYLNGGALDFFFNLNQTNSATSFLQSPEDMLATLEIIFTNSTTHAQVKFFLNGDACGGGPGSCIPFAQSFDQQAGLTDVLQTAQDKWAYVHGQICVTSAGAVLGFGTCTPSETAAGGQNVNQNLGANNAAFALFSQGAENALNCVDPITHLACYDVMSADLRMAAENNGFEQLFILPGQFTISHEVPEPASISIVGGGLLLLGLTLRRRQKRARVTS
jgi:hypothetical protein